MLAFCLTFNDRVKQGTYCKWTLEKKQDEEKYGLINWVTFQAYRENVFSNNGYQLFDHLKKRHFYALCACHKYTDDSAHWINIISLQTELI